MKNFVLFRIIILMISAGLLFTACKKDQPSNPGNQTAELEFVIQQTDFGSLKSTREEVPQCDDQWSMDYVVFNFNGTPYTSPVFLVDGELLTQAVKVVLGQDVGSGVYQLTNFLVYHDVTGNGKSDDDLLLRAAPAPGSTYHHLMVNKLNLDVTVEAFKKHQVIIDVLCFEELFYDNFGFTWFELNDVRIERQCFFGDICVDDFGPYAGSYYASQSGGLQMDMPAIMQIKTYKMVDGNWEGPMNVFDNVYDADGNDWFGEGDYIEVY